jgi:hypothetical protein
LLLLFAAALGGACIEVEDPKGNDPRLLDRLCGFGRCETSGSAKRVSALTPDSTGFRLGPGEGQLTLEFDKVDVKDDTFPLELLVSGRGTLRVDVPGGSVDPATLRVDDDYAWRRIKGKLDTDDDSNNDLFGDGGRVKIVLSVDDENESEIELVDVRSSELDQGGCSVASVGRRR